jgi:hypothetical protein
MELGLSRLFFPLGGRPPASSVPARGGRPTRLSGTIG